MKLRRRTWILLTLAGALGVVGLGALAGAALMVGDHPSLTTNTDSAQLKTSAERVAFLGRYLKLRTRVTDASFHIWYQDNSVGLPGPSDWSITAILKVTPADGPTWLDGATPLSPNAPPGAPLAGGRLIPSEWEVSSPGVAYTRDKARLVWHSEGVLEFAAATN